MVARQLCTYLAARVVKAQLVPALVADLTEVSAGRNIFIRAARSPRANRRSAHAAKSLGKLFRVETSSSVMTNARSAGGRVSISGCHLVVRDALAHDRAHRARVDAVPKSSCPALSLAV